MQSSPRPGTNQMGYLRILCSTHAWICLQILTTGEYKRPDLDALSRLLNLAQVPAKGRMKAIYHVANIVDESA